MSQLTYTVKSESTNIHRNAWQYYSLTWMSFLWQYTMTVTIITVFSDWCHLGLYLFIPWIHIPFEWHHKQPHYKWPLHWLYSRRLMITGKGLYLTKLAGLPGDNDSVIFCVLISYELYSHIVWSMDIMLAHIRTLSTQKDKTWPRNTTCGNSW